MNPPPDTATLDPKQAEREAIKDINQDYKTKFGFNDPETGYVRRQAAYDVGRCSE